MQSGATHIEIKALCRLGWTVSAIAREYVLSRNTLYAELASPTPRHSARPRCASLSCYTWSGV